MFKYANVQNGKVKSHQESSNETNAPHLILVTSYPPIGSTYSLGVFTDPVIEIIVVDPIRIISVRAFFERLPSTARKSMTASTNADVIDILKGIQLIDYVDLDGLLVLRDLGVLVQAGELTQIQADAMLVDGQVYEAYNGTL